MDFPAPAFRQYVKAPARDTVDRSQKEQMDRLAAHLGLDADNVDPVNVLTEEEARGAYGKREGTSKLSPRGPSTATASALQAPSTAKARGSMVQKEVVAPPQDFEKARLAQTFAAIDDETAGETKFEENNGRGTEADKTKGDKQSGGNKLARLLGREKKRHK